MIWFYTAYIPCLTLWDKISQNLAHLEANSHKLLTILGELQSDFYKNLTEFYQISLKNLPYLTDFSPQLMACMILTNIKLEIDN